MSDMNGLISEYNVKNARDVIISNEGVQWGGKWDDDFYG